MILSLLRAPAAQLAVQHAAGMAGMATAATQHKVCEGVFLSCLMPSLDASPQQHADYNSMYNMSSSSLCVPRPVCLRNALPALSPATLFLSATCAVRFVYTHRLGG